MQKQGTPVGGWVDGWVQRQGTPGGWLVGWSPAPLVGYCEAGVVCLQLPRWLSRSA